MYLKKQKDKTGVAILNKPSAALCTDPKFQGSYREESIRVGERLALASLAAEIHCLQLADITPSLYCKYIGRGQYPKFFWKPNVPKKPVEGKYVCEHTTYWVSMYGYVDRVILDSPNETYISELSAIIARINEHLPSELTDIDFNVFISIDSVLANPKGARLNAYLAKKYYLNQKIRESSKFWTEYVRNEFARGGGKLFKWISSEEKQFLSINLSAMMPKGISLNSFVQDQALTWSKLWHPANGSSKDTSDAFISLWHKARDLRNQEDKPLKEYLDDKVLFDNISKYKKNRLVPTCGLPKVILQIYLSLLWVRFRMPLKTN